MNVILFASAWLALSSPAQIPQSINVDAKSGDTISGEKSFRVTVNSSDQINQVEFYVGDDLRDTETSTPYTFPFDTVDEGDGDVKIRFKAYTDQNKTFEKVLTVHVNNEKSKGADYHVKLAQDDLTDKKFQLALDQGRIAMKIDPANNPAKYILARANLGMKVYDKAQKFAEDAVTQDPKNDAAYQLLAAIDIQRAFSTFAKGDADRADVLSDISDSFKAAVTARQKSLDLEVDAVGAPTDANVIAYADATNKAGRYSLTISALQDRLGSNPKDPKILGRLVYADLRSGKYQEALDALNLAKGQGPLDAYGLALQAELLLEIGRVTDSDAALTAAIEADPDNVGVRTAQSYIALKENKTAALSGLVSDLAKDEGQRPTVNYFLMALANRQQRFGDARKYFEKAVLTEPSYPDPYIEQANYSLGIGLSQATNITEDEKKRSMDIAKLYFQTALVARPEAVDALCGLATLYLVQKDVKNAVSYAEAARSAAPDEAAGHYMAAAAYQAAGRLDDARTENEKAGMLDTVNLQGRAIPDGRAVFRYLLAAGRIPVISAP